MPLRCSDIAPPLSATPLAVGTLPPSTPPSPLTAPSTAVRVAFGYATRRQNSYISPGTAATHLLSAASAHLAEMPGPSSPITCHVLDTSTGLPARDVSVSLTLLRPLGPSAPFRATTDADGRVRAWANDLPGPTMAEVIETLGQQGHELMEWALRFDTGTYFGAGNTFFPEVEVRFYVTGGAQHYHVPLLLGPWSYTTYRGS